MKILKWSGFAGKLLLCGVVCLSAGASVLAQNSSSVVHDTRPLILEGPYLVAPSNDGISIVWITDTPCHSKVIWGQDELISSVAEPEEHGLVPVGTLHSVRLDGLAPGVTYRYKVVSTRVVRLKPYWPEKGLAVESQLYSFTLPDLQAERIAFSFITDTQHEDVRRLNANLDLVNWENSEFLVHGGDAFDWVASEEQVFDRWLGPVTARLAHVKPLVFARGNHDMRGPYARELYDYVPTETGHYYYTLDAGPLHLIVLDTGEDKDDYSSVYAGLNRFEAYREKELSWFRDHVETSVRLKEAAFRVILMHGPTWGWVPNPEEWTAVANQAGIDLVIAGHRHRFSITPPEAGGSAYHTVVVGQDQVGFVEADSSELKVSVKAVSGEEFETLVLSRAASD